MDVSLIAAIATNDALAGYMSEFFTDGMRERLRKIFDKNQTAARSTVEAQAFEQFFLLHYETIRRRAYAAGLDLGLAEDVTQEAMIIALRFWERISVMEHPVAYVSAIAINILRRVRRKEAKNRMVYGQVDSDVHLTGAAPGPENVVINRIGLERALRFVPAEQSECFVLHHMFGYAYREVAQVMGIPEGTVKSRVHAARRSLREIIGDDGTEDF
jgi:RNA polymerase sigma-70 factor, ECF subfamily